MQFDGGGGHELVASRKLGFIARAGNKNAKMVEATTAEIAYFGGQNTPKMAPLRRYTRDSLRSPKTPVP